MASKYSLRNIFIPLFKRQLVECSSNFSSNNMMMMQYENKENKECSYTEFRSCFGLVTSRPTRPAFLGTFGALPRGTPRAQNTDPAPPCPRKVGGTASGVPRRDPVLDTLVHEEIKQFNCEICDYCCSTKGSLAWHVASVHEGKKRFKFEICNRSFSQKSKMIIHFASVHGRKKLYYCEICDKGFSQKVHVNQHVKLVHEVKKPINQTYNSGIAFSCTRSIRL